MTTSRTAVEIDSPPATWRQAARGTVVESDLDPLADLIRAQRLAVAVAEAQGLNPDAPRNLTRSVVLADHHA
ncbi:Glucosamine-6-phosphate deaminase [Streptomyces venezuelae]|nr:Glucosamine-6-phosphate deaminase [Streptomyces venezuelae]CUM36138.1 Glucosamine-6-phosphate deaminase [isomerizing], alternative [Streptomyces venezuelae]